MSIALLVRKIGERARRLASAQPKVRDLRIVVNALRDTLPRDMPDELDKRNGFERAQLPAAEDEVHTPQAEASRPAPAPELDDRLEPPAEHEAEAPSDLSPRLLPRPAPTADNAPALATVEAVTSGGFASFIKRTIESGSGRSPSGARDRASTAEGDEEAQADKSTLSLSA